MVNFSKIVRHYNFCKTLGGICLLSALALPMPSYAQGVETLDDLLDLDLESLASVEVSVASKHAERISEAPGIITVVTRKEIEKYGGINLLDIFHRVPSMQVISSAFAPTNVVGMRGQTNQHYTNRILFLINGRPFRDGHTGGWNMGLFTQFPLNNIEQIEIIRGPGSVLYGTNAFSGVVNIITRKADKENTVETSLTYGSFNHRQFDGRASYTGKDWSVVAALNKLELGGDSVTMTDENGLTDAFDLDEGGHGISLLGTYKNITVQAFNTHIGQTTIGATPNFPTVKMDNTRNFLDIGYIQDLWGDWQAQLNATYNRLDFFEQRENLALGEVSIQGPLTNNINLLSGISFEHHDGTIAAEGYNAQWHSAYGQLDWKPVDWLKLVGGLQFNDSDDFKGAFSPRAAIILTPHRHWGAKILYGEAFRAATAIEAFVDLGFLIGDSNNQPETIATLEGQIFYENDGFTAAITGYRSRIEDIIGRINNPAGGGLLITNTGKQVFEGIEFESKVELGHGWSAQGSAAYQRGKSDTNIKNPTFFTNITGKAGILYEADKWSFGAFNSYYGDPEDIRGTNPNVTESNPQPKSYNLLSANLEIDVDAFLETRQASNITFTLHGENLLDEDIRFPEFNRKNINSFPIDSGRSLYARLTVKF